LYIRRIMQLQALQAENKKLSETMQAGWRRKIVSCVALIIHKVLSRFREFE